MGSQESPGETKSSEVELGSEDSPGEIKSREVELGSEEIPGEIKNREVELCCHSRMDYLADELFLNSSFSGTVCVTSLHTAVETAISEVHKLLGTGRVPTSLTLLFWRWLTVVSVFLDRSARTSYSCPTPTPNPLPQYPSLNLINLVVSEDVKHPVYLLNGASAQIRFAMAPLSKTLRMSIGSIVHRVSNAKAGENVSEGSRSNINSRKSNFSCSPFNPFIAPASKIFGPKETWTSLQTVYFPVLSRFYFQCYAF